MSTYHIYSLASHHALSPEIESSGVTGNCELPPVDPGCCSFKHPGTVYVGSCAAIRRRPRNNAYNYVVSLCNKIDLCHVSLPSACTEEHYVLQPALSGLHSASQGQ